MSSLRSQMHGALELHVIQGWQYLGETGLAFPAADCTALRACYVALALPTSCCGVHI
jgi:hypothetical protein